MILNDLLIAIERGELDHFEALEYMADAVERRLADALPTTQEIETLEVELEHADRVLMDVAVDEWARKALGALPTTLERN